MGFVGKAAGGIMPAAAVDGKDQVFDSNCTVSVDDEQCFVYQRCHCTRRRVCLVDRWS